MSSRTYLHFDFRRSTHSTSTVVWHPQSAFIDRSVDTAQKEKHSVSLLFCRVSRRAAHIIITVDNTVRVGHIRVAALFIFPFDFVRR